MRRHEFPNLIALCPSCHDLHHRGAIDAPALRAYKRNLALLAPITDPLGDVKSYATARAKLRALITEALNGNLAAVQRAANMTPNAFGLELERVLGDPDLAILYTSLLDELRFSTRERIGMIAHLVRMVFSTAFTLEEKSRVLRATRSLEPQDILELRDRLDRRPTVIPIQPGGSTATAVEQAPAPVRFESPYSDEALFQGGCLGVGPVLQLGDSPIPGTYVTLLGRAVGRALESWHPISEPLAAVEKAYEDRRRNTRWDGP